MSKQLVIFGTGSFAEVAHYLFTHDSDYEVAAFTAHEEYIEQDSLFDIAVVPYESVTEAYPPSSYEMFVAVGYNNLNQTRANIFHDAKEQGYALATYVSSKSTNWAASIGENTFIFEDNTLQPFVEIGDNAVLWSGNHIGHHSKIGDHCFITSHVVISGHVVAKPYSFFGVNATVRDDITIGESCIIGAGALIMKSAPAKALYIPDRTRKSSRTSDSINL